jgi:hypothetical protein
MGVCDAGVDASETTVTMFNTTVFALGALGAGLTCVVIVFPVSRSAKTSTTISYATAAAWQVLRSPDITQPAEPPAEIATIRPRTPLSVQTVRPPLDRLSLTRTLQRELKKIGCYRGDINGVWTNATRKAMEAFTQLANAKLPIDQPNHVLLALVQSDLHQGCSVRCRESRTNHSACPEATPALPKTKATASTSGRPKSLRKPPMGQAGSKASESKKRPKRSLAVGADHWAVTLWRNTAN